MSHPSLLACSWEIGSANLLALVPLVAIGIKSQTKGTQVRCCRMQLLHMYCSLYIGLITEEIYL
jgi:hypothetical protein